MVFKYFSLNYSESCYNTYVFNLTPLFSTIGATLISLMLDTRVENIIIVMDATISLIRVVIYNTEDV